MIKIILRSKLLSYICFFMAVGLVSSCKKDTAVVSDKVELISFGPSGAKQGEQIIFIGTNLDQVTAVQLAGALVPGSAFTKHNAERIEFIIPLTAEQGFATLKTPKGDVVSKTKISFLVMAKVASIPMWARPGDNITIKGDFMNWVTSITFGKGVLDTVFVSKSLNQLVVKVPQNAQSGTLIINFGGTKPVTIETDSALHVVLPAVTNLSPVPIARGGNLTISGTNLLLTSGIQFKGVTAPVTSFVSQSDTQIVVTVPAAATKGKVSLVAYSGLTVQSAQSVLFIGDLPDLAPLDYAFYTDALQNSWQNWGWSSTTDFGNTDNVRDGAASIKQNYTGQWGAVKFAGSSVSTTGYATFAFSVFGTAGTGGNKINITPSGGSTYTLTIIEGAWNEYNLTMAQIGNPATITDITFQNQSWTGIVYIDQVGFRK